MSSKWCVTVVLVLWTIALSPSPTFGSNSEKANDRKSGSVVSDKSGQNLDHGRSSSSPSLSDLVKQIKIKAHRIRRATDDLMLKVRLSNGSYIYRKVSSSRTVVQAPSEEFHEALTRVARGYANKKKTKGGYGYTTPRPKGYVYTTPSTTRAPPESETTVENDSQFQYPEEPPPDPSTFDREAETTTTTTPAPVDDPWDIRDSVPGEPGKDYSVFGSIPETSFTCEGRTPGFYADIETKCQVFHRCTDDPWYTGQVRVTMDSFLCPNGSLFNQQIYTCDWWGNVDCASAQEFYQLNEQIGQLEETDAGTIQYVQFSGVRVPPPPGQKRKSPRIIPKSQRNPLPEMYRSRHTEGGYSDTKSSSVSSSNGAGALSADSKDNADDPERLAEQYDIDSFAGLSASTNSKEDSDKEGSSQNIDEVSEPPPTKASKKSSRKASKKSKKATTTTTTTQAPEISDEEEESEESGEEDEEEEEEPAATNDKATGLIINRPPLDAEDGPPSDKLKPPPPSSDFRGEPVDSEGKETKGDGYIPPTKSSEGPTYIPPTESTTAASEGYNYPKPTDAYLPPKQGNDYLPPKQGSDYLPPKQNEGYNYPKPNDAYLPPKQGSDYLPPKQTPDYLPPKKDDGYLPPKTDNGYLPPKTDNGYLPPKTEGGYLSGSSPATTSYLPPTPAPASYIRYTVSEHTYSDSPDSYYRKPSTGYGAPTPVYSAPTPPTHSYGPPPSQHRDYLPPSHPQQPGREYLPNPQQNPNQGYSSHHQQPNNQYLPNPSQLSQQPNRDYLPPSHPPRPNNQYLPNPSEAPNRDYLPPSHSQQPSNQYLPGPPQQPSHQYLPSPQPQRPNNEYLPGPPQHNSNQGYSAPQQPSKEYLPSPSHPQQPNREYLPSPQPQRPDNQYLPSPPQHSHQGHSSGHHQPGKEYLPSPPQQPNREYLPVPQQPSREYLPNPQQHSNQGYSSPPKKPSNEYLPSPQQQPNREYLPQQHSHQGYSTNQPQHPNREYLPAPQQPSHNYLPTPQQNSNHGYSSNSGYNHQQPNREYLPAPSQAPSREYLPQQGYSQNRSPVTVEHWPAKYDYEAPTSPSSVQKYIPPTQSTPVAQNYGTPNYHQNYNQAGYQTQQRGLIPPSKEYGQQSANHQQYNNQDQGVKNEYLPVATPTVQSLYSTIPVQTPPPRDDNTGGSRQPYVVKSPINIEFYQVPLVSYSQVVHPNDAHSRVSR